MVGVNNQNSTSFGTTRDGFGKGLVELGEKNNNVVVLSADLMDSTRLAWFKKANPERFFEVGVAEENMIGIAAGLALAGKIPFASSYSTFVINNALGPIRSSICYSNTNVKIAGGHSGFSASADGATHQGLEDIATLRPLPNMIIVVPCDQEEARKATHAISKHLGPAYLRLGKYKSPNITTDQTPFEIGKANVVRDGTDLTIVACGSMVALALDAAEKVDKDISVEVINMHTIKPLDYKIIKKSVEKTKQMMTIEEHQKIGGLGSAVAEMISQDNLGLKFKILGVEDSFGESGSVEELFKKHGLDSKNIEKEIRLLYGK